jgi:hypothetical protein
VAEAVAVPEGRVSRSSSRAPAVGGVRSSGLAVEAAAIREAVSALSPAALAAAQELGEGAAEPAALAAASDVELSIGELPAGQSVTITFDATVADPFPAGFVVSNQGSVSGDNFATVLTDDPAQAGAADATETEIHNVVLASVEVPGDGAGTGAGAGWRYFSAPVGGLTVADLAAQNRVQGVPGFHPAGQTNLYTGYDGTAYTLPATGTDVLSPGSGFVWFLFDRDISFGDDPSPGFKLPFSLEATGPTETRTASIALHAFETGVRDGWNLIGNPWPNPLDVSDLVTWASGGSLQSATPQVWDPAAKTYVLTTTQGDRLETFEGAFLENDDAVSLDVPADAQIFASPRPALAATASSQTRLVAFELRGATSAGAETLDRAAVLYFHPDATHGWDVYDAGKLVPLSGSYALLAFLGERTVGGVAEMRRKAQDSRPVALEESFEVSLDLVTRGTEPTLTLSWPRMDNIPGEWVIKLVDHLTGVEVDLRKATSYSFEHDAAESGAAADAVEGPGMGAGLASVENAVPTTGRFTLIVAAQAVDTEPSGTAPREFMLTGVYPNPVQVSGTVAFELAAAADVSLVVYDLLGRRGQVIGEGRFEAGRHVYPMTAAGLPSGTYVVRMRAETDGGQVFETSGRFTVMR